MTKELTQFGIIYSRSTAYRMQCDGWSLDATCETRIALMSKYLRGWLAGNTFIRARDTNYNERHASVVEICKDYTTVYGLRECEKANK